MVAVRSVRILTSTDFGKESRSCGRILVGPRSLHGVLDAVGDIGDVAEAHGRAVAIRNDDGAIGSARDELVVGSDRDGLVRTVESPFGRIDVGCAKNGAKVFKAE